MSFTSCTEQSRIRNFGGAGDINLEPNQKLVMATWKNNDLWFLTRSMTGNDSAENYSFSESSSVGVFEGTIFIHEVKR